MPTTPLISFIVSYTTTEDGATHSALMSCLSQSVDEIEVICVDTTPEGVVFPPDAVADPRVRVIRAAGISPAAARRRGADAAAGAYVMFLDPQDSLVPDTAIIAAEAFAETPTDLIGLGVTTSAPNPEERPSRPHPTVLQGTAIVRHFFPESKPIPAEVDALIFRAELLRTVHDAISDVVGNDDTDGIAVAFLACAAASTLAAVRAPLYYGKRRGADTGRPALDAATTALRSLTDIEPVVRAWARHQSNPEPLVDGYESLRSAQIARAFDALDRAQPDGVQEGLAELRQLVGDVALIAAVATFAPSSLPLLSQHGERILLGGDPTSILLTTNVLTTGGVSGVLLAQAQVLLSAGYRVTIVTHRPGSDPTLVPTGATLTELAGSSKRHRLERWAEICATHAIDVVIDHRILYSRDWAAYALAARAHQAPTVGWIHNFAGRPTYNGNDLHTLMRDNMGALAQLIVLSPLDVAFWKLRGVPHVAYLPNPASPLLVNSAGHVPPKSAPSGRRLEVVWWGRLEEHTKKVTQLVEVAAALKRLGVDFRMRIVGPDWTDMSSRRLSALVQKRDLDELVEVTGPRHGQDLLDIIDSSDVFINTSIIEGYLLTVPEAQSRGLPVVMYDLPWLLPVQDNPGVIAVAQGDAMGLATEIAALGSDSARYEAMSQAAVQAARQATSYDLGHLYRALVSGALPAHFSPEPTVEDGRKILNLLVFFAEKSAASDTARGKRRGTPNRRSSPRSRPLTIGARVERKLTPVGHQLLDVAPWLRPVARRVKQSLLRS